VPSKGRRQKTKEVVTSSANPIMVMAAKNTSATSCADVQNVMGIRPQLLGAAILTRLIPSVCSLPNVGTCITGIAVLNANFELPVLACVWEWAEMEVPMLSEVANVFAQNAAMLTLIVISGLMALVRWSS
jgi:hypothetical protein